MKNQISKKSISGLDVWEGNEMVTYINLFNKAFDIQSYNLKIKLYQIYLSSYNSSQSQKIWSLVIKALNAKIAKGLECTFK